MGIISWFKRNILKKAETGFKIKIVKSWFSSDWYNIKFSNDNGGSWAYIIDDTADIFSPYGGLKSIIKDISSSSIKQWARDLDTYEKCVRHNKRVREHIDRTNDIRRTRYITEQKETEDFIKKFNNE